MLALLRPRSWAHLTVEGKTAVLSGFMMLVAALVLASTALSGPSAALAAPQAATVRVDVDLSEFKISPSNFTIGAGDKLLFNITNKGNFPHNLHIGGNGIDVESPRLTTGQSALWEYTFTEPGTYALYCSVNYPRHREAGMDTRIVVGPAGTPLSMTTAAPAPAPAAPAALPRTGGFAATAAAMVLALGGMVSLVSGLVLGRRRQP